MTKKRDEVDRKSPKTVREVRGEGEKLIRMNDGRERRKTKYWY